MPFGMVTKKPVSKNTVNGIDKVINTTMSPIGVFTNCMADKLLNNGINRSCTGMPIPAT